jgi:hypothetical protein
MNQDSIANANIISNFNHFTYINANTISDFNQVSNINANIISDFNKDIYKNSNIFGSFYKDSNFSSNILGIANINFSELSFSNIETGPRYKSCQRRIFNNSIKKRNTGIWRATGEYIEELSLEKIKLDIESGIKLLKDSKFMHIKNNSITTLNQDSVLIVKNKIKIKCGNIYIIYGENVDLESNIEILTPIIDFNGFGIQTTGNYNILLNNESKIKIHKGEKVNMIGLEDKLYSIILDEDLIGYFVEVCEEKKIEKNKNVILTAPKNETIILTKELLAKLNQ